MQVIYFSKENKLKIRIEDKDVEMVSKMRESFSTEGYKFLLQVMGVAREKIIDKITNEVSSVTGRKNSDIRAAVLKGFTECASLPAQIVQAYDDYMEENNNVKELGNE